MGEFEEFAEALFGQLEVEIGEEREIAKAAAEAAEENRRRGGADFGRLEEVAAGILPSLRDRAEEFLGVGIPGNVRMEFPELAELKRLKGRKVFAGGESAGFVAELFDAVAGEDHGGVTALMRRDAARYLVYSTYAIQYISKITTTYGDCLDSVIYLNRFVLSRYPYIILHRQRAAAAGAAAAGASGGAHADAEGQGAGGVPDPAFEDVNSGYRGAVKMTILEELVHAAQGGLQRANRDAAARVNGINEELARIVLSLDAGTVSDLSEYCQLQAVPDDFPFAKRANLFFFLNPDHFLIEQIGPDVMTFTHVEIDPRIGRMIPQLLDIYRRWLVPIQEHHAAFTAMEGMAGFAVREMLGGDPDFRRYLATFMGTDISSYQVRKGMGMDFTRAVYEEHGRGAFGRIMQDPPDTRELKEPRLYLERLGEGRS